MKFKTRTQELSNNPGAKKLAEDILEIIGDSDTNNEEDYAALMAVASIIAHQLFHEGKFVVPIGFNFQRCVAAGHQE